MPNYYYTSTGERITDATIKARLSKAYRERYGGEPHPRCEETGLPAQGSSHIVSQARCKQLHKSEMIYNPRNFFPATHQVNSRWESNDVTLRNYWTYMDVVKEIDPEGYQKRINL